MPRKRKPKVPSAGDSPLSPITAKERRKLDGNGNIHELKGGGLRETA
jgi:hypothetical protein